MDFTSLPRPLIYLDRTDIEEFPIESESFIECIFFESLTQRPFFLKSDKASDYVLKIFNNAYYICLLIQMEKYPSLYLNKYLKIASANSKDLVWENIIGPSTMALVCNILHYYVGYNTKDGIIRNIYEVFQESNLGEPKDVFFSLLVGSYKVGEGVLFHSNRIGKYQYECVRREIDSQAITEAEEDLKHKSTSWKTITENYNSIILEKLKSVLFSKNLSNFWDIKRGKRLFLQSIKREANSNSIIHSPAHVIITPISGMTDIIDKEKDYSTNFVHEKEENDIEQNIDNTESLQQQLEAAKKKIEEQDAIITELKENLKNIKNGDPRIKKENERLISEKEEMIVELLTPICYNQEEVAKEFLNEIQDLKDPEIADIVVKWTKDRKISDRSNNRPLWRILHAAKLYESTESNWNTALKRR